MDSLMDAMTNVVGILLLILIVSSLGISAEIRKIVENIPDVTEEQLQAMKDSRKKTLDNLEDLKQTYANTEANAPKEDEKAQIAANLKDLETNNKDLAAKTNDIAEWKQKVDEQKDIETERKEKVVEADTEDRRLAAILANTKERKVLAAKDVKMPNPRVADERDAAHYLICKNGKVYYVGDPYSHAYQIRDVIDKNFKDLAYVDKQKPGHYTWSLLGTRKNPDNGRFEALKEDVRLTRRMEDALAGWKSTKLKFWNKGKKAFDEDRDVVKRLFGNEDKKEWNVQRWRYDLAKIQKFFGDGKFGPKDFRYYVSKGGGDRIKYEVAPREEGGWTADQLLAGGSEFDKVCKQASINRNVLFYYYVAPDSFDVYLQARSKSEGYRIPAGWSVWEGEKLAPQAVPQQTTAMYDLDTIPAAEMKQLADSIGPWMAGELRKEHDSLSTDVAAAMPKDLKPAEQKTFTDKLTEERREWIRANRQGQVMNIYTAALVASEAGGRKEVQVSVHPPEIPHIRIFSASTPPTKPKEEESTTIGEKPGGGDQPVGGNKLILD